MASTISELATLSDLTGTIYLPAIKLVGSSYSNYKIDFSSFVTPSDLSDYVAHSDFSANGILKRTALGTYTSITDNSSNWDTAYSWGDHSGQGYLTSAVTSVAATVPTGFTVSGSPITTTGTLAIAYDTGYQGYTTTEATKLAGIATGAQVNTVDSVNTQTGAVVLDADDIDDTATTHKFVAAADISNWNTAFGWGNHASAGYLDASDIGVSVQAYDANLPTWPVGVDATEVGYLNGVTSSIQTQLNGKITAFADPNADRIVFWDDSAGAFAALTASTGLTISGTSMTVRSASATQTGIVELATDAETTTGTDTTRAITPANLTSQIGTRLQAYSSVLENTTASFTTADETKLDGIETAADVTDATNVAAAGAVMDGDFVSNGLMARTGAGTYSVVTDNSTNWDTAFGWGNHASAGYMATATYDPTAVAGDAFDMDNMVEGTDTKIMTADERTKLGLYLDGGYQPVERVMSERPSDVDAALHTYHLAGSQPSFLGGNGDTGIIEILIANDGSNTMVDFFVDIYQYSWTRERCTIRVAGYLYNTGLNFINASAWLVDGDFDEANFQNEIEFGLDAANNYIINIGTASSVWAYPTVKIRDFTVRGTRTATKNIAENTTITLQASSRISSSKYTTTIERVVYESAIANSANWDTAYGWGDHSVEGYLTGIADEAITEAKLDASNTPTDGYVLSYVSGTGRMQWISAGGTGTVTSVAATVPTGFTISGSPITASGTLAIAYDTGYQGYTTAEASKLSGIETSADVTDATNVAAAGAVMDGDFVSNGLMSRTGAGTYTVVTDNSSNWNTAFGWGNHASAGYITSSGVTYENLNANGDVGTGSTQVAAGNHTHSGVYEPVDADILRADTDDNLTAGYTATADNDGTKSSGTYTPDPAGGNLKYITANGAFTLAAPTASGDYTIIIQITNGASAGTITFSGFAASGPDGDAYTTTNGDDFMLFITKINGFVLGTLKALQ